MAAMCPMKGCKAKQGLCIHEKMMVGMAGLFMALAGAHWGLGLF
jgi:hypothetical protein